MLTIADSFRIAAMVVVSLGGFGAIVVAVTKLVAESVSSRLAARYQRETDHLLAELRGKVDEGLARLNAALQHRNFVLQRLAEIELNGLHSCWRAAITAQHLLNGVRPHDCGTDAVALRERVAALASGHNTLLTLAGKYDPFLDGSIRDLLYEITKTVRLELAQAERGAFASEWWDQGDRNKAAMELQIATLRANVQRRVAFLRELSHGPMQGA